MATKRTTKKTTSASAEKKSTPSRKTTATKTTSKAASRSTKTAPKTAAPRTAVKSTVPAEKSSSKSATKSTAAQSTTSHETAKPVHVRKSYVALIIAILLIGALLYFYRGVFVAAVVNGQPISRMEVIKQTEQTSGKQTLDTLVRNALIEQKAKQENVSVSDQEINDEIKKLQDNLSKQGQNIDQVLQAQGMSRDDLKRLIRLDKLVSKMVGKDVTVTDNEVSAYIEKNKDTLPQGTDQATLKKQVSDELKQQKTNEKVRTWLADLQKQASIKYYVQY